MNRREFCTATLSMFFMNSLLGAITRGLLTEAHAATQATPVKNYVGLWMDGGAERVWFDAILNPNGASDPLGAGPGVFNALAPGGSGPPNWVYKTTNEKVNGKYYLPYLWESMLPTAAGGTVAMKSLASNLAIIRGVQTGLTFDAHAQNVEKMQVPFPGVSILGAIADDTADAMIPAILTNGHYISNANKPASRLGPDAGAGTLFEPVQMLAGRNTPFSLAPSAKMGVAKLDQVVTSFIQSLAPQAPKRKVPTIQALLDNRKKAVTLLQAGFGGIQTDYETALNNYLGLIQKVMNPDASRVLVGLDDRPIVGEGVRFQISNDKPGIYGGYSLLDGFKSARCMLLAHGFAKAEVFLKYKISNCLQLEIGAMDSISNQYTRDPNNNTQTTLFSFDCHYTGDLYRGIAFSRYYQALAACLAHFKLRLQALPGKSGGNLWSETVVHLRSDFNRGAAQPRGSDHNILGCVETFIGGAIQDGPIVAGNIQVADNALTIGSGAAVAAAGNQPIDSKFIYSTVGSLLGYTPSRNHAPILAPDGLKIVSKVEAPRNIKG